MGFHLIHWVDLRADLLDQAVSKSKTISPLFGETSHISFQISSWGSGSVTPHLATQIWGISLRCECATWPGLTDRRREPSTWTLQSTPRLDEL